jgi:hypothetical protein
MSESAFPDFYMVGAPKCGTTALYDFLRQHPEIFLPETKELLFFGSDLSYPSRLTEEGFLAHYAGRRGEKRAGAAHTAYLQSVKAAEEIRARRADADIIAMVRNPLEMLPSWHSELLYQTVEDIEDFEEALDAEADRRQGRRLTRTAHNSYVESLYYSEVAAFSGQVERYLNAFGRPHVHVIIHDDLRRDAAGAYRTTLEFLRVDTAFVPEFAIANPNKMVRSRILQNLYFATAAPGHRAIRKLLPRRVRRKLLEINVRREPRGELPDQLRRRLEQLFRDDVTRLGALIGRDLSGWIGAGSGGGGDPQG